MKHLFYVLAIISALYCTAACQVEIPTPKTDDPTKSENTITAEKIPWSSATKGADKISHDFPWAVGDKLMLIASDQTREGCKEYYGSGGYGINKPKVIICTVVEAKGLKCSLEPSTELTRGTYRAFYPVYDIAWYDYVHLCFLYNQLSDPREYPKYIIVSDPIEIKKEKNIKFEMNHICALLNIAFTPPHSGNYKHLKLFAEETIFAGKANYMLDKEYDVNEVASGWLNFTALQADNKYISEAESFSTSTALLSNDYDNIPVCLHIVYEDGTHFVSDSFGLPSLEFGKEVNLTVANFKETTEPLKGLMGNSYKDPSPKPYNNFH